MTASVVAPASPEDGPPPSSPDPAGSGAVELTDGPDLPLGPSRDTLSRRARRIGALVQWGLVLAALGSLILFSDELPDFGAMWRATLDADRLWLVVVVLAEALSMGAFARLQRRLLRIGGHRMPVRRAFAITYAGNALSTTLPAGPAVSVVFTFQQFRRSGASARVATAVIVVGGVITTGTYTLIGLLALLTDPFARGPALTALSYPAAAAAVVAPALLWRPLRTRLAVPFRWAHRRLTAHPKIAPWVDKLLDAAFLLRPNARDVGVLAVFAVMNWVCDILALFAAARAVGLDLDPTGVTLAYFAAQAAGSLLPLLPGGIGAIESSMAASLVALGAAVAPAAAAVGLYRLVSYWGVVGVGWVAWLALQERAGARARAILGRAGRVAVEACATFTTLSPYAPVLISRPAEQPRS
ncbi:lysylphosphatidylglycerol synthase transmembrane domain-containing protein [Actinomadura oligospora]|uniref:lysylphosphatidylglycerol synthase transmembrane domain-containing protein n=1 Tax=Actinomadura oligospora TaxID=111804 RepID=UPI0004BC3EE9|nr:lysylphosphatidylglycerol synthase transmembrane domain-containing protein [Actinomadura oligospora]